MKRTQKLNWLFTFVFLISGTSSFSQTLEEFFKNSSTQLTYLGVDYSLNLIIKDADANTSDIKDRLYSKINNLVIREQGSNNYNIGSAFGRKNDIYVDTNAVTAKNDKIDDQSILSSRKSDFKRLKEADISKCVESLPLDDKEGIGLVFIMEGMKKAYGKGYGSVWVTLINMKTKTVLMTERMEQEAVGIGFRNYWVSVIRKTIMEIDWRKYKEWKKKYAR